MQERDSFSEEEALDWFMAAGVAYAVNVQMPPRWPRSRQHRWYARALEWAATEDPARYALFVDWLERNWA